VAKGDLKKFIKRRPSWFWWILANLLAAAFAVSTWSVCLYLFNFPERPANYELLHKLKRLPRVNSYEPFNAPDGSGAEAQDLLSRFFSLPDDQLAAHNRYFKRNYITNFKNPEVVSYVVGSFRVTHARALTAEDFFHPGLAVRAQATVQTDELAEQSPYPVILELLLPFRDEPAGTVFPAGHTFDLSKIDHRGYILHAAKLGRDNEPTVCLTVVPIAYPNYADPTGKPLPLASPDPLNVAARFPLMEQNRAD